MNITLISGSPKTKESASIMIMNDLKTYLEGNNISEVHLKKPTIEEKDLAIIKKSDIIVFSSPLYVDSVPSHLLSCLITLEKELKGLPITVYAISNCGFYEGIQNKSALKVLKNWCDKTTLTWGQGVGFGAGPMYIAMEKVTAGKGMKKNIGTAFKTLSSNIKEKKGGENIFYNPNLPRIIYKIVAEIGWKKQIKENGLSKKELYRKLI